MRERVKSRLTFFHMPLLLARRPLLPLLLLHCGQDLPLAIILPTPFDHRLRTVQRPLQIFHPPFFALPEPPTAPFGGGTLCTLFGLPQRAPKRLRFLLLNVRDERVAL